MNGAESLIRTLLRGGVNTCFTNPGTSEIHIVAALDRIPEMRCVLGLFEGVVTGAADGYARMAEKPACTLLHLGPGFANGLANLHNAKRAQVPMVNLIGQHPADHLKFDTPLVSDIEGTARPYSDWLRTSTAASRLGQEAMGAVVAARTAPGQIATLIVAADAAWQDGGELAAACAPPIASMPSDDAIQRATTLLRSGRRTAILLSGNALYGKGLLTAGRIAAGTGAKLFAPYPVARLQRGAGLPPVDRIMYQLEQGIEQFKDFPQVLLVGAQAPRAYFAYPGKDGSFLAPGCEIHTLAEAQEDRIGALAALEDALSLPNKRHESAAPARPQLPSGAISLTGIAAVIGAVLPENAIVVDESMTSGRGIMSATKGCLPHDWLGNTGGSIGIAMPLAVGAAVACPGRRVLCLSADGSGMYTLQALWTMARERLKVTTLIFANRTYGVLKREFSYLGIGEPGKRALDMFDIDRPDLNWVDLAEGMGVPAERASTLEQLASALQRGFENDTPSLIEIPL